MFDSKPSVLLNTVEGVRSPGHFKSTVADRLRAAGIHFACSAALVGACVAWLLTQWYPGNLIFAAGALKLLGLIVAIDLILGPLLTCVVFDRRKKSLPFDLAFIVVLQLAALTYGMYVTYMGRPVFQVFVIDRFELLSAAEVDAAEYAKAPPQLVRIPFRGGPLMVAHDPPKDPQQRLELTLAGASGFDAKYFLRYYTTLFSMNEAVLKATKPISDLDQFNSPASVTAAFEKAGLAAADRARYRYLPLQGRQEDLTVLIDATSGATGPTLRLVPWRD